MKKNHKVGILGSGSWAIALAKVLVENGVPIVWWIRQSSNKEYFEKNNKFQHYLPHIDFSSFTKSGLISTTTNIKDLFVANYIMVVTPSAFVDDACNTLDAKDWEGKKIVSATKGLLPKSYDQIQVYLQKQFNVTQDNYVAITGPSHAEELANQQHTYLTCCSSNNVLIDEVASLFDIDYISIRKTNKLISAQYVGIIKNIYAIASGICVGLNCGDNFKSVLIANATKELYDILHILCPEEELAFEEMGVSNFFGDLLVTCYSEYSRNQRFGKLVASGCKPKQIYEQHKIIAEGYFATYWVKERFKKSEFRSTHLPILDFVIEVLCENIPPTQGIRNLTTLLK